MDWIFFQTDKILELSLEDAFNRLRSLNKRHKETLIALYRDIMGGSFTKSLGDVIA